MFILTAKKENSDIYVRSDLQVKTETYTTIEIFFADLPKYQNQKLNGFW